MTERLLVPEWPRLEFRASEHGLFAITSPDNDGLLCVDRDPVEALRMVPGALRDLGVWKKADEQK